MGNIAIIHAPESREFSCVAAGALAAEGHAVQRIESTGSLPAYDGPPADAVIVVWSVSLIESPAMLEEARRALARRVLVPVAIGDIEPPGSFAHLWPIDLAEWKGDVDDPRWQFVRDEISLAARRNEPAVARSADAPARPKKPGSAPLTATPVSPRSARSRLPVRLVLPGAAALALMTGAALWAAKLASEEPALQQPSARAVDEAASRERLDQPAVGEAAPAERLEPPQEAPAPARAVSLAALAAETEPLRAGEDSSPPSETAPLVEGAFRPVEELEDSDDDAPPSPPLPAPQEDAYAGLVFRDCLECPDMAEIPAGVLEVVAGDGETHLVTMDEPFAVSRREITFREWEACVAGGGCRAYRPGDEGWGRDRRPAINVSFEDAQAYVDWLSAHTGRRYRLPTEAEWEFAAGGRGAGRGDLTPMRANYDAGPGGARAMTAPTASFSSSVFGLYDVFGNVWEWTDDCERAGAGACAARVLKGGAFDSPADSLRASARTLRPDNARAPDSGFRVVRETP